MGDAHWLFEYQMALVIHSITMLHGCTDMRWDEQDRFVRHVAEVLSYSLGRVGGDHRMQGQAIIGSHNGI